MALDSEFEGNNTIFRLRRILVLLLCVAVPAGAVFFLVDTASAHPMPESEPVTVDRFPHVSYAVTVPLPTPYSVPSLPSETITTTLLQSTFWDLDNLTPMVSSTMTFFTLSGVQSYFAVAMTLTMLSFGLWITLKVIKESRKD